MENKLKNGLILGGILTVATVFGVAMTKDKSFNDFKDDYESIINNLKKSLNKIEYISKKEFASIINTVIEDYSKTKEITKEAKNSLISALNNKWDEIENEIKGNKF
ncbi:MAG: hypothetical protein PHV23_04265 [Candidatus Gracilibacteria bacterium]|nr:hypothetical protein [Candidatus Gracilibacteria bacterium]